MGRPREENKAPAIEGQEVGDPERRKDKSIQKDRVRDPGGD